MAAVVEIGIQHRNAHRQREENNGHRRPVQAQQRRQQHQQSRGDPGKARDAVRAAPVLLARKRPRQPDAHGEVPPYLRQIVAEDKEQQPHEHRHHGADVHFIAQPRAKRERTAKQRHRGTDPQHHRPQHRIHIPVRPVALGVKADEVQRQNKQRQAEHRHAARRPAVCRSVEAPMRRHRLRQARVENGARQQRQQADQRGQQQLFFVCLHGSFSPFKSCNHSSTSSSTEALRL